ncbi:MAG TPA: RusA family crossover junction endodeoxyribonuclease [Synergistaceae bacterium]|nr:RusA family crossover junction endodeoxyribonuclease [Synergistaceae bacterium]
MKQLLDIFVPGKLGGAGSKVSFKHPKTGRIITTAASKYEMPWKDSVRAAVKETIGERAVARGPIVFEMTFVFVRPSSHLNTSGMLNKKGRSMPLPTAYWDTTKLVRSTEDALNKLLWYDDKQVVKQVNGKEWGPQMGARIIVREIEPLDETSQLEGVQNNGEEERSTEAGQ